MRIQSLPKASTLHMTAAGNEAPDPKISSPTPQPRKLKVPQHLHIAPTVRAVTITTRFGYKIKSVTELLIWFVMKQVTRSH